MPRPSLRRQVRLHAGRAFADSFWWSLAQLRHVPRARPGRHGLERISGVAYRETAEVAHTLDVYRPKERKGALPVVLYIHGGGFRILSKDTHWLMAIAFARRGYVVLNINYRLAPTHPFPGAAEDACAALVWASKNAWRYGGDPERIVLAGESAGGNLVTMLAGVTSYRRPEPWAREVWDTGVRPRAVLPACGMLQVSDVARFERRRAISGFIRDRLHEVEDAYLPPTLPTEARDLADPLVWLEGAGPPERPLPPFFAGVGTADVLLDDTRRLKVALDRLGAPCEARYYPREIHAFHAMVWRPEARAFWRDTFAFLERYAPGGPLSPEPPRVDRGPASNGAR